MIGKCVEESNEDITPENSELLELEASKEKAGYNTVVPQSFSNCKEYDRTKAAPAYRGGLDSAFTHLGSSWRSGLIPSSSWMVRWQ